uniref:Uncharacterized protein n=1 Tax=Anguilla anguilla TaxID=7936 RepID=A0A0E9TYD6_ANGAN
MLTTNLLLNDMFKKCIYYDSVRL